MRSFFRSLLSLSLSAAMIAPAGWAQEAAPAAKSNAPAAPQKVHTTDYSKPVSHFPFLITPYVPRKVAEPSFNNTPRIDSLIQDGKLNLSLDDAIALALENNLDLAIARYNLDIAETDVLRAKAGQSTRGVATGLVQGTPGGGVGGFGSGASGAGAGGTTSGTGGAGTGASGLVQSTVGAGSAIASYDPVLSATLEVEHAAFPLSNTVTTGTNKLQQNTGSYNFNYFQGFKSGTSFNVGYNNSRQSTNSLFTSLNPTVSSSFRASVTQHLLQGFGLGPNMRFIRIARNNKKISDSAFENQVITTVSQIQNIYWDLVNAYEDVKVKERSVALANKTLNDNKKQVEIGTLAPIEIVRAESEVATRNQDLIVAQTNLQLQQLLMKNAITRKNNAGQLANVEVVPTDTMVMPSGQAEGPEDLDKLTQEALQNRPDLTQTRIDLTNREITRKSARNALLPTVDAFGFYGGAGLAGDQNPLAPLPPGTIRGTGYDKATRDIFQNNNPDYGAGLTINIPLRNRAAQADQVRSELELRQAELRAQQLENQIGIEVRNAQYSVQQNRARVEAAIKGRTLAEQSLDAEQKKYSLGASTNFLVLQAQRDLVQAESNVVAAMSAYEKSRVELDRVTARTLKHLNISITDAQTGVVTQKPDVPNVGAQSEMQMQPAPQMTPAAPPAQPDQK